MNWQEFQDSIENFLHRFRLNLKTRPALPRPDFRTAIGACPSSTAMAAARDEVDVEQRTEWRQGESPAAAEPSPEGLAVTDDDAAFRDLDLDGIGGFETGGGEPEAAEADVGDFEFVEDDGL